MSLHRGIGGVLIAAGALALLVLASFSWAVRPAPGMHHVDAYADPGTQITVTDGGWDFGGDVTQRPIRTPTLVAPGMRATKDVFLGGVGVVAVACGVILLVTGGRKQAEPSAAADPARLDGPGNS